MISYLGTTYVVDAGQAFVFPHRLAEVFYYYPPEATEPWSFVFCVFQNLDDAVEQLNARHGPVYDFGRGSFVAEKLLKLLEKQQHEEAMISGPESFRLCADIIEEMDRIVEAKDRGENGSLAIIARDLIYRQREKSFFLPEIAAKLNVSPEHLCREFRRHLHTSPKQYHDQLRIKSMKERLINSSEPTKEIAQKFGFQNTTNFIAFFKKHTSLTPREFRQYRIGQ